VRLVTCGYHHTLIATDDQLLSCGTGEHGQLGLGDVLEASIPMPIDIFSGRSVCHIACSRYHCGTITEDGTVWTWGRGEYGQLGHGDRDNRHIPTRVDALIDEPAVDIGCGWGHSMVCSKQSGMIYTWGFGGKGQLGHGNTARHLQPKAVSGIEGAVLMACGYYHNLAATKDAVYSWGKSDRGQLGHGDTGTALSPTIVKTLTGKQITYLDCGDYNSIVATDDKEVYIWGRGQEGQIGNGKLEDAMIPFLHPGLSGCTIQCLSLGWGHGAAIVDSVDSVAMCLVDNRNEKHAVEQQLMPELKVAACQHPHMVAEEFGQDYKDVLQYPELTEAKLCQVGEVVDGMLSCLDEYGAVLDTTKVDTKRTWDIVLPRLIHNAQQMEATFQAIDELERYVIQVREAMQKLEQRVEATEEAVTSNDSMQSKVLSFFGGKKSAARDPVLSESVDYIPSARQLREKLVSSDYSY